MLVYSNGTLVICWVVVRFQLLRSREALQEIGRIAAEMDEYEQDEENEEWIEAILKAVERSQ